MKRKIEDYIGQKVAVECSSKEEWDKIDNLFGKKGLTRNYGDVSDPDNTFVNCIHINGMGTASKKYYEKENYSIYPASDFLEEVIPEYVEYIDTKYKGQIVKVEEWTNHSFCCIRFENGQREQPFKNLVKPSTKEAYDLQEIKPKVEILPYPTDKKYFKAVVTKDIHREDISTRGSMPELMPKGYQTWFISENTLWREKILSKEDVVCPENNRWTANIPAKYFQIVEDEKHNDIPKECYSSNEIIIPQIIKAQKTI